MKKTNLISVIAGAKLKKLRIAAGYKIPEFALLIHRSEQQLMRYESGVTRIDLETLLLYLKVLNANMCDFIQSLSIELDNKEQNKFCIYREKNKIDSLLADISH